VKMLCNCVFFRTLEVIYELSVKFYAFWERLKSDYGRVGLEMEPNDIKIKWDSKRIAETND
jgi:hypothetical protein